MSFHKTVLRSPLRTVLTGVVVALLGLPTMAVAKPTPLYAIDATGTEVRFGGTVGSGANWVPQTPQTVPGVGFSGRVALTCSGLDYGGFLKGYKASDFINEIKNQFIGGAQAMLMTYLITTAYSNPTLASVIDMMNQGYSAKFNLFQSACNAQEAKQRGLELGARRIAESQHQCYEDQVKGGASPTQAYQTCANEATFGPIAAALPAGKSTFDFLTNYTNMKLTKDVETLLGLLPDERVTNNGYEMRPPRITMHDLNQNIENRTGNAIDRVLNGVSAASIADCTPDDYFTAPSSPADACLPPTVADIVQSPAFLAARQLSPEGRRLYRDAMSSQLSIAAIRAAILDLISQVKQMDVKDGAGARANEVTSRKKTLEEQIMLLQREADALQNFQQAKANAIRTQILAMDMVNQSISRAEQARRPRRSNTLSFDAFRSVFGAN